MGYGISTCATCDGYFFKEKNIVVVGGGDSAMEEASFLTKFAKKVTIIHRREVFKASKIMLDRVRNNPLIDIVVNKSIESIKGTQQDGISSIVLKDTVSEKVQLLNARECSMELDIPQILIFLKE
jgi:thioredoxin reductase (NADPH)